MIVKIGNKFYNAEEEPIMIILNKQHKKNIANMAEDYTKYCVYPDNYNVEEIEKFMKEVPEELLL